MRKALYVPLGDGEAEAVITLQGCGRYVDAAVEAARRAIYEAARREFEADSPPEDARTPGAPRRPCGCGEPKGP